MHHQRTTEVHGPKRDTNTWIRISEHGLGCLQGVTENIVL